MHRQYLDKFQEALESDRAMTAAQARSLYRVTAKAAREAGAYVITRTVKEHCNSNRNHTVRFLTHDPKVAKYDGNRLRHLAGTVALRQQLDVHPSRWVSDAGAALATFVPDAVWESESGRVAVEYDAGSYSRETVMEKGRAFMEFEGGQVWGVASEGRVPFVVATLREAGVVNVRVLHAPWV